MGRGLVHSRRLQGLARVSNSARRRWMQRLILALALIPLLSLPVLLLLAQPYVALPEFLRSDMATIGLILLTGLLAIEPVRALHSFLRARVLGGRWRGWRWVQRILVTALLAVILLPASAILAFGLTTWLPRSTGVLLLICAGLALALIGLLSWQIEALLLPVDAHPPTM